MRAGSTAWGQRIVGSCAFVPSNYAAAVDHLAAGRVPVASLVSARVSMDEAPDMFQRLLSPGQLVGRPRRTLEIAGDSRR